VQHLAHVLPLARAVVGAHRVQRAVRAPRAQGAQLAHRIHFTSHLQLEFHALVLEAGYIRGVYFEGYILTRWCFQSFRGYYSKLNSYSSTFLFPRPLSLPAHEQRGVAADGVADGGGGHHGVAVQV
jgi:hypothetical protein